MIILSDNEHKRGFMKSDNKTAISFLSGYFKDQIGRLMIGFLLTLAATFLNVNIPRITGAAIDYLKNNQSAAQIALPSYLATFLPSDLNRETLLIRLIFVLVGVSFFTALFRMFSRILLFNISRHVEFYIRNDFLAHLQKQSPRFFQENKTGDLMALATNDISAIRHLTGQGIVQALFTLVTFALALYSMIKLNPMMAFIALTPLPLIILIVYLLMSRIDKLFDRIQDQFAVMTTTAQENFAGIRVIKSYVREKSEINRYAKDNQEYVERNLALNRLNALFSVSMELLLGIGLIAVILIGSIKIIHGELSLGSFVAFIAYVIMLEWPMIAVGWLINLWQQGLTAAHRVHAILEKDPDIADNSDTRHDIQTIAGEIEFQNVTFRYNLDQPSVIENFTLKIPRGCNVAIVGPTGSGKSTLVHLLARLYEPTSGTITIDGNKLTEIPLQVLRANLGIVQQESFLFSDTLAANIAFGAIGATDQAISQSVDVSQLKLDLDQLPQGLETMIGERGITLSGGQKQRTSISRALMKNPAILILDDAFSSVDTYTEDEILKRIRPLLHQRTTIIVAHRISTVQHCDLIIFLKDGKIAEQGKHKDLLTLRGHYFSMHQKQQLEESLQQIG
ncbi:MAG: ABC transporter ATP-binding protein [Calditrichaeota bacterium]|nr:MAG: ABC transporter ATP-binding protein [Calditrichota bacterium]